LLHSQIFQKEAVVNRGEFKFTRKNFSFEKSHKIKFGDPPKTKDTRTKNSF